MQGREPEVKSSIAVPGIPAPTSKGAILVTNSDTFWLRGEWHMGSCLQGAREPVTRKMLLVGVPYCTPHGWEHLPAFPKPSQQPKSPPSANHHVKQNIRIVCGNFFLGDDLKQFFIF